MDKRYNQLIDKIISQGYLMTDSLIETFRSTPRRDFLPDLYKKMESINAPLPLPHKQTASQPLTIAFMLELLDLQPGQKVLEIGYGSGWQTALISKMIMHQQNADHGDISNSDINSGEIIAYEIDTDIAQMGEENIQKTLSSDMIKNIHLHNGDYNEEFISHAPFDRIVAGAAFDKKPTELIKSLSPLGVIVYPTAINDIRRGCLKEDGVYLEESFPGFRFVPIRHES